MCLSYTYLCMVLYGWKEATFRKIEKYFHIISWGLPLGITVSGIVADVYTPNYFGCRMGARTYECVDLREDGMCYAQEESTTGNTNARNLLA